jgi:hypothetical protein
MKKLFRTAADLAREANVDPRTMRKRLSNRHPAAYLLMARRIVPLYTVSNSNRKKNGR